MKRGAIGRAIGSAIGGAIVLAVIAMVVAISCGEKHACTWTVTVGGAPEDHCRDDLSPQMCVGRPNLPNPAGAAAHELYTPNRSCRDLGYTCSGDAVDGALRRPRADGTCPPGSSRSR